MQLPQLDYLRWIRQPATHEGVRCSLVLSGMPTPDASFLEDIPPARWLDAVGVDHPPLAQRMATEWGLSPRQVLLQPGSHWNILLAVASHLRRRWGPVIVEEPAYEPMRRIPAALGAPLLRLPRRVSDGRRLDLAALESLGEDSPSLLVFSHPHNPSMATLSEEEMEAVATWSRATGCAVLSDEVYLEFLDDPEASTMRRVLPEAAVIRSFTKVMGLGSIRASVLIGPEEWIASAAALSDYGPGFLPAPSLAAAEAAWDRREELWRRARRLGADRRPQVRRWAEEMRDILEVELNDAGIIAFCRLHPEAARAAAAFARRRGIQGDFGFSLDGDPDSSIWWIEDLRRRDGVLVTPGAFFEEPQGFRLGFGVEETTLEDGLALLSRYLREATAPPA